MQEKKEEFAGRQGAGARGGVRAALWVAACLAMYVAGGCTSTVSRGIGGAGLATEVVFPPLADAVAMPEGTFPNLENLRTVGAGQSKDQVRDLLGSPHFREGLFGVREWDYVFNFRSGGGVTTCQYKVIFDRDHRARSFHWKPGVCAAMLNPPPAPVAAAAPIRSFRLTTDALFPFDRADPEDMQPDGRQQLQRLAAELRGTQYDRVEVVGHTDRLGSASYNQRLSEQRAEAVREVLVQAGIPAARIAATGRGDAEPVVQCDQRERDELIACLAPNRRVDVRVQGTRQP